MPDMPEPGDSSITEEHMSATVKIYGTRKQIISALAVHGDVTDPSGRATGKLIELAGLDPDQKYGHTLSAMQDDGVITREINGKRTKRIALVEPAPHPRYQALIDEAREDHAYHGAVDEEVSDDDEVDVLAKLQAAQDRIAGHATPAHQQRSDDLDRRARELAAKPAAEHRDGAWVVTDPEPEPEPRPAAAGGVDYDELAVALLDRVGEVLGQDKRYVEQRLEVMEADLRRAREQMAEAREMAQRERQAKSVLEDENRTLKSQNSALRQQVRERDDNIERLTQDHREIGRRAVSEASRRQLERTITEAPRVGVPA